MAIFRIKILSEKLFSKRGKLRKDKQQRYLNNPKKPKKQVPINNKPAVTPSPAPAVTAMPQQPKPQQPVTKPAPAASAPQQQVQTPSTPQQPATSQQPQVQQQSQPQQQPQSQVQQTPQVQQQSTGSQQTTTTPPVDHPVGPFPTGQQGTTGSVDWAALGSGFNKTVLRPAAITAGVLGAGALGAGLLGAKKVGDAVSKAAEEMEDKMDENRRYRREEKMAKRLIKAGFNPYQEGQRIGGYSFTRPFKP